MPEDAVALVAPYLTSATIGPRAARSRRIAAAIAERGQEPLAIVVDRGAADPPARVVAAAPGPLSGDLGGRGMDARRRLRTRLAPIVRRVLPVPDAHARWALALSRDGRLRSAPPGVRAVYALGPPFSSLVLGAVLARRWGVPLIGDAGDPWPPRGPAEARLADWTLRLMDGLVVTNRRTAQLYLSRVSAGCRIAVAPNGADVIRARPGSGPPLFLHLGTLSRLRTDPNPALAALVRLNREGVLRFRSLGEVWVSLRPEAEACNHGIVPPAQARELMGEAAAMVVIGNRDPAQIPSKVYEIARSDLWGLYVSELGAEPGAAVLERSGHAVVAANREAAVRAAALEIVSKLAAGLRPSPAVGPTWEETVAAAMGMLDSALGGREDVMPAGREAAGG